MDEYNPYKMIRDSEAGKNYKEAIRELREVARLQEEFGIDFTLAPEKEEVIEKQKVEIVDIPERDNEYEL